jgi:hypothetical protein
LVSTSIILDDVGLGDTGGDLVVGGMSTGITSNDSGVQLFTIEVRDNSKLQTINSTNNTLREVNIVNGATTSSSTAYVTTVKDAGDLTVNGTNFNNPSLNNVNGTTTKPVYVVDTPLEGTNGILGTNQTIGHSINGSAGFTDVRLIDASAMVGKFAFTAAITSDSILKYHDLIDTQANPAADVATAGLAGKGANFIYTGGTNSDTMTVVIDAAVASSRSTTVSGQSDFTFNINGAAGDDNITVAVNNTALAGGAQAWYTNQKLNANITIDGGDGNDTIRTPGAGDVIINGGVGNDTIYTDNTGALNASPDATGTAGTAAVAYANAAAAELTAGQAAAVASNTTGFVLVAGTNTGAMVSTAAAAAALDTLNLVTPVDFASAPTYAAIQAAIATALGAGGLTFAQATALDTAYGNAATADVVTPATTLVAQTLTQAIATAGTPTLARFNAGNALLDTYITAAKAAAATATANDLLVTNTNPYNAFLVAPVAGELLNATQQAVVVATQAVNGVFDAVLAVAAGTQTTVSNLAALQAALVVGATDAQVVTALQAAVNNGAITAGVQDAALFAAATSVAASVMDTAEVLATSAWLTTYQTDAINANTAANAILTAALAADVTAVNTAANAAAANALSGDGVAIGAVDSIGSTEAANAQAAAAAALNTFKATTLTPETTQAANLAALKSAIITGSTDLAVVTATSNAVANLSIAAADKVTIDAAATAVTGTVGTVVTATEKLAVDVLITALQVTNQALVDSDTIYAAKLQSIVTATTTASTIATAAANSGANSLTLAAPKAVFVFDTSNQSASYNKATMDDRNLADLKSDANNSYNFFNSTVKVTYKGIDASVVVAGGTDFKTTDLQINQALKLAINSDAVLSKLLLVTDGPANSLVVTSLIDGTHTTANLAVTVTLPTTAGSNVAAAATSYGLAAGATDAQVLTAMSTAKGLFDTKGDYTTQFAESGAANANVTLTGANSVSSSDNTITGGTGNDVIVLGTTVGTDGLTSSNEKVIFAADFGNDTVVHFAASGLGIDTLDFSALNGRGNVALNSLSLDKSIVIGAPTATPLSATAIAALFTDSATAINHVYVEVNSTNIGSVYTVADAAGTTAGNVVATLVGTLDLADTAWGTLTAANFA